MFFNNETVLTLLVCLFDDLFMLFVDYLFVDTSIPLLTCIDAIHITAWGRIFVGCGLFVVVFEFQKTNLYAQCVMCSFLVPEEGEATCSPSSMHPLLGGKFQFLRMNSFLTKNEP